MMAMGEYDPADTSFVPRIELDHANAEIDKYRAELHDLDKLLGDDPTLPGIKMHSWRRERLASLQNDLAFERGRGEALLTEIGCQATTIEELQGQLAECRAEPALIKEIERLRGDKDGLEKFVISHEDTITELTVKLERETARADALERRLADNDSLQAELKEQAEARADEAERELAECREALDCPKDYIIVSRAVWDARDRFVKAALAGKGE